MGEGVSSMLLVNVLSGTEYSVKVIASYSTGPSEPLSGRAKTREFSLPRATSAAQRQHVFRVGSSLPPVFLGVSNLTPYQVRVSSLCAQWQPQRHASTYRLLIQALPSEWNLRDTRGQSSS